MKNEDFLISIITPYYRTLNETKELAKVLEPQLSDNVEWIIIDDGCHEQELDNIKAKIIHLENNSGGGSVPRNVGLDTARGKYILFIDSDDSVAANYLRTIKEKISTDNFDYCYFGWESPYFHVIIEDEPPEWNCSIWNCIYKRSIIGDTRFDPKLQIGEDYDFNVKVRKGVHTSIKEILYYYHDTPNSLMKRGSR